MGEGEGLPGEICYGNSCLPVQFLTTKWTVDQVQQVLNLYYIGYSPYKIARTVHRRTVDVYQIIYHRQEVQQVIEFLTVPHGVIKCNYVEETVLYISTTWSCEQLTRAYDLLNKGYSAYAVARIIHKRYADVIAIRNHIDYFKQVIIDIMKKKPGILKYNEYEIDFALPGYYSIQELCQMYRSNDPLLQLWLTSDDPDAKTHLMVVYIPNPPYNIDLFRGCVLTYDMARLLSAVLESMLWVQIGIAEISPQECITVYNFCDFEWILDTVMSKYSNILLTMSGVGW